MGVHVFCLMAARRLPKWRAVRREPTETKAFEANINTTDISAG